MTDFAPSGPGGTSSNPNSTIGPSWFTSPTLKAGVMWKVTPDPIYMGGGRPYQADASKYFLTPKQAKTQIQNFNDSQIALMKGALAKAGMKYTSARAASMWGKVVDYVQTESQNGHYVDPFTMLSGIADGTVPYGAGAPGSAGRSGSSGPTTRSIHSQRVDLTNATTADGILDQALQQYLGRTATDAEKKSFLSQLNTKEKAAPTVTTGSETQSRTSSSSNVTSKGGVNASEVATQAAMANPEYGEYQYATKYMDAFLGALGSPVSAAGTV